MIIKEKEKEKEKNEYYQNIILYIEKINTDNNDINEGQIKELKIKSESLDKKLKLKEDPDFNILLDGIVYSILLLMAWMKVLLLLLVKLD